jgi:hypothetical protein
MTGEFGGARLGFRGVSGALISALILPLAFFCLSHNSRGQMSFRRLTISSSRHLAYFHFSTSLR